jgi:histidinol-phosphate aminotransferase
LAGLRIGYGVARPEIINYLNQPREPFNVNLLAQETALAALTDKEHLRKTLATNQIGKKRFYEGFEELGLNYVPTEANFVWVDVEKDSKEVFQSLLRRGVITRTGDIFNAPTYLRITIGTEGENEVFLSALKETLGK